MSETSPSTAPTRSYTTAAREVAADSLSTRILRAPATWLVLVVGLSTTVRAAIGFGVPSPWILPDEVVYSELAKSIAEGGRPSIRGVPIFGWGEVYPTVIAPAWALFEDPVRAYHAALGISAFVMSLAALPAYALARMFVPRKLAALVAAMTVLVPSMAYSGVVMTENAFYPVFLLSVLLIARSVRAPTIANQALALAGLALVAFTRIQGMALVGAYLVAVVLFALTGTGADRWRYARRFVPTVAVAVTVSLAPVGASLFRGDGAFGWLGARSGTFDAFRASEVPQWFAFLVADLVLYVAVAPALATVIMVGRGLRRTSGESARLFAAVALPTIAAMVFSVSLVSASFDVDGTENLNERYVFYVVPLLFLGLAVWINDRLPRPRPWTWVALGTCCVLTGLLPIDRLGYNAAFQSLALLPWLSLDAPAAVTSLLALGFTLLLGFYWLVCRRDRVGHLWLISGVFMALVGVIAVTSNAGSARTSATSFTPGPATWLDGTVPAGERIAVLWKRGPERRAVVAEFRLFVTEFFNPEIGDVYRIGRPTYYETFLPTVPVSARPDGRLTDDAGRVLSPRYVLVTCRTPIAGKVVRRGPRGTFTLVEVDPPLRLLPTPACR